MFKKVGYALTTAFLRFLGFIGSLMSIKTRSSFGKYLGRIMKIISPSRKRIALDNLRHAFEGESRDLESICGESFENLGITLVELMSFPHLSAQDFHDYIKYDNIELLNEMYSRGKGLILLSGHFGNWELLAYSAGRFSGLPVTVIVKPQKNYFADKRLNGYRTLGGNKIVSMYHSARKIVTILKSNEALALLADQAARREESVEIDFFGRSVSAFEAPARLALRFGVPIVMGFAVRQPDATYRVRLREVTFDDLRYDSEGVLELTRRHNKILEEEIRLHPGLWAWQHRRWKRILPGRNAG